MNGFIVSCGKHPGTYRIAGGHPGDWLDGNCFASTLYSTSTCPCKARFLPSQTWAWHGLYHDDIPKIAPPSSVAHPEPAQYAQTAKKKQLSSYLTGDKPESGFVPDYPVLRNTGDFPDKNLRNMLKTNNHDVMLLTPMEAFEVLQSWGWKDAKTQWVETTQSDVGQVLVSYGVNVKDVVTTSMVIARLGDFGIKATLYINHKGTELIKLSGYPGIRKILNAPVFAAKNPKVVDLGIGKYGMGKSIVEGTRLTFYVAAAYRTLDFILNDETSLAAFIGSLATDVVKLGIASAISWGVGAAAVAYIPFVSVPLVIVISIGLLAAWGLNELDNKFGATDKVVAYIEAAQQEFVEKARKIERGVWDLGAMYADRMLDKGKEVVEHEIKRYLKDVINNVIPRKY